MSIKIMLILRLVPVIEPVIYVIPIADGAGIAQAGVSSVKMAISWSICTQNAEHALLILEHVLYVHYRLIMDVI